MNLGGNLVIRRSFRWILFGLLMFAAELYAQGEVPVAGRFQPSYNIPTNASEIVIKYNLVHHMIAEPDPEPLLLVYGDGRVKIHIPDYMIDQGDYELYLSRPELIALVRSLVQDGIIEFDRTANRQHRHELETLERETMGTLYQISDVAETLIDMKLDDYRPLSSTSPVAKLNKQFIWDNLEHDAKRYPEWSAIQKAAAGEQKLRNLLNRSDRWKIR